MTHSFAMWVGLIIHLSGVVTSRGHGFKIKRREGGAGGGRSASPRKASHEWCPQGYSISLLSLGSVYKYAQYSCRPHVGFKLKQRPGCSASPRKASHGHDTVIRNVGGPYHPPLWLCHSITAKHALRLIDLL